MADELEKQVDAALEALARDVNAAAPRPDALLMQRVLADAEGESALALEKIATELVDPGLARLAREVNGTTPRPGTDLTARVLADAASIAPPRPEAGMVTTPARPRTLRDLVLGWTGGAVAALSIGLTLGIAVGMEMELGEIPMLGEANENMAGLTETFQVAFLSEELF